MTDPRQEVRDTLSDRATDIPLDPEDTIPERPDEVAPMPSLLRALVDLRDRQVQKSRIQFGNRLAALERGADPTSKDQIVLVAYWKKVFDELEEQLDKDIARQVRAYPIFHQLRAIRGIGPMLAAKLIALIPIEKSDTASALVRFSGYAVIQKEEEVTKDDGTVETILVGTREYRQAGVKATYNVRLKTVVYLIAESFIKCNSPYRLVYDEAKIQYQRTHPEWTKRHIHLASMRKMSKVFLCHCWQIWRGIEGLPVRNLYVEEYLGHHLRYKPEDFGWPSALAPKEDAAQSVTP